MNKELKRLALEVADELNIMRRKGKSFPARDKVIDEYAIEFATRFLAAVDAERGKEAVAWHTDDFLTDKSATTYDREVAERWKAKGWPVTPHFLAPQIPEGVALVPKKFSKDIAVRYLGRELLNMDRVWFSVATRDYEQMIAAAGEKP